MDAAGRLTLLAERAGSRLVIRVLGDLDYAGAPKLTEAVQTAAEEGVAVCVLDLGGVEYMDSEALRTLILLRQGLQRSGVVIEALNCSEQVVRILELVGLDGRLQWLKEPEPGVQR